MTTLGDDVIELIDTLLEVAGVAITVTRGTTTDTIQAVKGRNFTERFGDESFYGTSLEGDFIVKRLEYIAAVGSDPERLDTITWTDDRNAVRTHQVGVDGLERQYDPVGQFGHVLRIHTTEMPR